MIAATRPTRRTSALSAAFVACCLSAAAEEGPAFEKDIQPIVEAYCYDCHKPERMKGDLNIQRFETTAMVLDSLAIWQRMAKRIESREMPPRDRDQPTDEERELILKWVASLKEADDDCNRIATEESVSWYPGYVMSRRLNRFEYENTLRDLLGVEVNVAELFPADGAGGEGFDNNGSSLFLSAIQMEKYLVASDLAIETALPTRRKATSARGNARAGSSDEDRRLQQIRNGLVSVTPGAALGPREAARQVVEKFAAKAWRRPVAVDEIERLMKAFDRGHKRRDGFVESVKLAFKSALVSPNFIFLAEPEPPTAGNYELGGYPLASRLSYFLWSSMPDEELFQLAAEDRLRDPEVLKAQVTRMLRDPKARALGEQFALQWLGINQLGETAKPDAERFPEFDESLAALMKQEAAQYFARIVREDRTLIELIHSDYTLANERLASIYGIDGVSGESLQVVQLADARRGGVLGMAAVLTATSHPLRTSPVLRGKWVLEQLLGDRVPPPPPDAGTLPEDDVQPDGLTLRARMEAHRTKAECASCHARMDPIGFGLENFDPIGRWRDEQGGLPVDSKGELPSGEVFNGPEELKNLLLARKDEFAANLSRKMLGYALGRSLTRYDNCVVEACVEALKSSEYRASTLFHEIVLSYPFRHRYSGGESESGDDRQQVANLP